MEWQSVGGDIQNLRLADAYNHATGAIKNYASILGTDTGDRTIGFDGYWGNICLDFDFNARQFVWKG